MAIIAKTIKVDKYGFIGTFIGWILMKILKIIQSVQLLKYLVYGLLKYILYFSLLRRSGYIHIYSPFLIDLDATNSMIHGQVRH